MTGGRVKIVASSSENQVHVELKITYTNQNGVKEVVCSTDKVITMINHSKEEELNKCKAFVPDEALLESDKSVSSAVTEEKYLIGRDNEKQRLNMLIPLGVTLIYGPSRIGKTSLMNWIRNKHAIDQGNVITVLIGGEGLGRDSDYKENISEQNQPVPYNDSNKMSHYLLIDTLIYGLTDIRRLGEPSEAKIPNALINDMLSVLKNTDMNIYLKYREINSLLVETKVELWLLLDEFQQVVESWKNPTISCEFFSICKWLASNETNKPQNIKFIFCGSDDLLSHMILKHDSVWRDIFKYTVPINALKEESFHEMILTEPAIKKTNLKFADSAISALFNYTGGIALYGKEICRAILNDIFKDLEKKEPEKWKSRNTIYTSDIAEITQQLLDNQDYGLSIKAKEGISTIYADVTKNLDKSTDKQMLWYMAKWIEHNSQQDGFPESHFRKATLTENFGKHLNDSLAIAEARGIIKKSTSHYNNETVYTFNTLFYYNAFLGSAINGNLDEELIFAQEETISDDRNKDPYDFNNIIGIAPEFDERYSAKQQRAFLGALALSSDKTVQDSLRRLAGTNIDTLNNVQINIQSMSNAFATLLSGDVSSDKYLAAFSELPSVQNFIPQESKNLLEEKISALHSADNEDHRIETENSIEEITSLAEQEMTGTYIAAAMNSTDFFTVTDEQWETLIHVSKKQLEQQLPPEFITSLGFAVMLHNVFESIRLKAPKDTAAQNKVDTELDYCPVAIMYCKIVEALLKDLHTPVYAHHLGKETLCGSSDIVFDDLVQADGTVDTSRKELTIGSFSRPIVKKSNFDESNNIDHPEDFSYEPKMWNIQKITGVRTYTQPINLEWSQHAVNLAVIKEIRNKSAHEARPITKANFDWLIQTLFDDGELMRIAELSK